MSNSSLRLFEHVRKNVRNTKYGILLTYTFDPEFFENSILPLINESFPKLLVFVDENEYYHLLKNKQMNLAGRKYYLIPVSLSGIFHPKLAIFISKKYVHLYVGSMNITGTGFLTNLETLYYIKFPNKKVNPVLGQVKEFLHEIKKHNPFLQESKIIKRTLSEILSDIDKFSINSSYETKSSAPSIKFVHNLHNPIINEITHLVDFKPTEIHVLGPFYGDFSVVETLMRRFPEINIYVYLQNGKFNGKVENILENRNLHFMNITSDEGRYIHAKLLAFSNINKSIIYVGSANPTTAGILKSVNDGGNLEIGIVHKIDTEILKDLLATLNPCPIRIDELKSKILDETYLTKEPVISGIVELLNNNTLRVIIKGASEIVSNLEFYVGTRKYTIKNSQEVEIEKRENKIAVVVIKNINLSSNTSGKNNTVIIKYPGKEILKIPITIKPTENSGERPIEDMLIINAVLDESFRINIEKILASIETMILKNKAVKKESFEIPNIETLYNKAFDYNKRYSTSKLLEKLISKIWELKTQFDKLIVLEDFENARSTMKEFTESLLRAYPYFSEYFKKTILEKIKNTDIDNIPSIIEVPPRGLLSLLGGTIKISIQDEHPHITIQTLNKELMSIFEVVKENDKIFLKIKDKNKLQEKAIQVYKNHYDQLIFDSKICMRTLLYYLFEKTNSFLHLDVLSSLEKKEVESREETNIFEKDLIQKILTLYVLVKILDPKFVKYHDPPLGILRAIKLLYPELLYNTNNTPIIEDIKEEITNILDSLKESGIDTPLVTYEDINAAFTNLIMEAKRIKS